GPGRQVSVPSPADGGDEPEADEDHTGDHREGPVEGGPALTRLWAESPCNRRRARCRAAVVRLDNRESPVALTSSRRLTLTGSGPCAPITIVRSARRRIDA